MDELGVGLIGTGYMGKCHALAWGAVQAVFGEGPAIRREHLCEVSEELAAQRAAAFGFRRAGADWRALIADPAVDVVSITTPNALHAEMAIAALEAGKHVWCEKPMATSLADAERMAAAARAAGRVAVLGLQLHPEPDDPPARGAACGGRDRPRHPCARRNGRGFHGRCRRPVRLEERGGVGLWRARRFRRAPGVAADDAARAAEPGDVPREPAFCDAAGGGRRPPGGRNARRRQCAVRARGRRQRRSGAEPRRLGAEGAASRCRSLASAAACCSTRSGSTNCGSIGRRGDPATRGFVEILAAPAHPPYGHFIPAPGHGLGFNDLKTIECHELLARIAGRQARVIDFEAGLAIERTIDAMARSAREERWVAVG